MIEHGLLATPTSGEALDNIATLIRAVPDFPAPGVTFRDITPLLLDPTALGSVVDVFAEAFQGQHVDRIAAIESRGFLLAAPLALRLRCGLIPIRKLGKLPRRTISRAYSLEYGTNQLEMHADAVESGQRVLIVDDVLATGGTANATADLIREADGIVVAAAFLIEIGGLGGREQLEGTRVMSLITY